MKKHGNFARGDRIRTYKFSDGQVLDMRAAYKAGEKITSIAKRFGASVSHTYRIVNGYDRRSAGGLD